MKTYYVYIITNHTRITLYVGVTNNLERRMHEHKNSLTDGFSKKYHLYFLVYYEETNDIESAISREKQLKRWHRQWKLELITHFNPGLKDLSKDWFGIRD